MKCAGLVLSIFCLLLGACSNSGSNQPGKATVVPQPSPNGVVHQCGMQIKDCGLFALSDADLEKIRIDVVYNGPSKKDRSEGDMIILRSKFLVHWVRESYSGDLEMSRLNSDNYIEFFKSISWNLGK